ncbi:MerR family transcriptional regulator [Planococcus sp. A6]|uniref:MerR family transcriptional regulator n=1 Tax=Planococcus sp. A6 TaxID=2992760 RepID=UPI00237ACA35|nr:MerR family transcriptional regulator [Planococcus sp. A6]MDE0584026.1 MerR family transcriptional regulator [Planococcus sp. A6]
MENKFSIGEMAKLHNTTIKTLHHYHKIDLLNPVHTDPSNGYRYYSTDQFEQLNTINYLKDLGFSLVEIKKHLEHRDIDGFLLLLEEQKQFTEQKIKDLERITQRFQNRISDIKLAREHKELMTPFTKNLEKRRIIRLAEKISSEPDLEISLRQLENQAKLSSSLFIGGVGLTVSMHDMVNHKFHEFGGVGLTVSMHDMVNHKFHEYNSIFILDEDNSVNVPLADSLPEGAYACIYYNGKHSESHQPYSKLLNYIHENNFEIMGDSLERTIINQYISSREEDYLTEIQIPINS